MSMHPGAKIPNLFSRGSNVIQYHLLSTKNTDEPLTLDFVKDSFPRLWLLFDAYIEAKCRANGWSSSSKNVLSSPPVLLFSIHVFLRLQFFLTLTCILNYFFLGFSDVRGLHSKPKAP